MAAVPVTLVGMMTAEGGSSFNCVFNGVASLTGLSVGGGPIIPPAGGDAHPEHPIVIPPSDAHPEHPIVLPPVDPGGPPISIWPGRPEHPIVLPPDPPPAQPPQTVTVLKAPPAGGGWGAVSDYGWAYYPAPGEAGPKTTTVPGAPPRR